MNEREWKSILFQICFSLAVAQKETGFVHNDLHTNNIMWTTTENPWIWFNVDSFWYSVPTYGRIIKIIDFGRSYIRYNNQEYFSDAFHPKGDAGGQYNYPPFYDPSKPMIPPNPSFDLPRLGCSIVEGMYAPEYQPDTPLAKLLYSWITDSRGKNIVWNRNGCVRFEGFGLYNHITRFCHKAIPSEQLTLPIFEEFITSKTPAPEDLQYEFQNVGRPILIESSPESAKSKLPSTTASVPPGKKLKIP